MVTRQSSNWMNISKPSAVCNWICIELPGDLTRWFPDVSHAVSLPRIDGIQMQHHDTALRTVCRVPLSIFCTLQYFMSELAYLIQRLNSTPDADGNTTQHPIFLFSELVTVTTMITRTCLSSWPVTLAAALQTGRLLDFKEDSHPNRWPSPPYGCKRQQLWLHRAR